MNSAGEVLTCRENTQPFQPQMRKPAYFEYDFTDDKPAKREKKWSFGNLFRRKKKTNDIKNSENNEISKLPTTPEVKNSSRSGNINDSPSKTAATHYSSITPKNDSFFNHDLAFSRNNHSQSSVESGIRRSGRVLAKVRAEAKRNSLNQSSSSDEDSQRSNSSSNKFRSDRCLSKLRDSSRKSKAARTERYLRRHSRDGENLNNCSRIYKSDADSTYLRISDENIESASPSPLDYDVTYSNINPNLSSYLGRSTIPLSNTINNRMRNSGSHSSYKSLFTTGEYNSSVINAPPKGNGLNNQRSISFDANIHEPLEQSNIIHARLELVKPRSKDLRLRNKQYSGPPAPPPRDPRKLTDSLNRSSASQSSTPFHCSQDNFPQRGRELSYQNFSNFKSSSDDHIPRDSAKFLTRRPSSTTPECNPRIDLTSSSDNYRYLTDKQSRSRKPIFIQNNNPSTVRDEIVTPEPKTTKIFLPSVLQKASRDESDVLKTQEGEDKVDAAVASEDDNEKSTNLEEALNELEAIYNSLKLGDENLLEMAEKREQEIANKKILENENRQPNWYAPRGALSDSGFCYDRNYVNMSRRKKYSQNPEDIFTKINQNTENLTNEPDVTLDDVVYRNIKQSNKMKVPEHPPPFGIPLGPITLTSNSDYLHAVPENTNRISREIPDLVKDDLAYRNLRKDNKQVPALPPVTSDDLKNNNINRPDSPRLNLYELRKSRPVRSKSANIGNLISREVIEKAARRNARDKNIETEYKVLTNIADAMHLARQVLKDKAKKVNENNLASMSDTDSTNLKYTRYPPLGKRVFPSEEKLNYDPYGFHSNNSNYDKFNITSTSKDNVLNSQCQNDLANMNSTEENINTHSDHDYENISSDLDNTQGDISLFKITNDTNDNLKKEPEKLLLSESQGDILEKESGETRVDVLTASEPQTKCAFSYYQHPLDTPNSSSDISPSKNFQASSSSLVQSLKSPKLVLETSKLSIRSPVKLEDKQDTNKFQNDWPCSTRGHIADNSTLSNALHDNSMTIAIACSYGVACLYHLAATELFALVSLIFAVLTFITTLFG